MTLSHKEVPIGKEEAKKIEKRQGIERKGRAGTCPAVMLLFLFSPIPLEHHSEKTVCGLSVLA